jgi:hypothetical protein
MSWMRKHRKQNVAMPSIMVKEYSNRNPLFETVRIGGIQDDRRIKPTKRDASRLLLCRNKSPVFDSVNYFIWRSPFRNNHIVIILPYAETSSRD